MNPYCSYEDFDFTIPVGTNGDTYDRFMVREKEMWESLRIIQQASGKNVPEKFFHADVPEFYLPPKEEVYNNMEALIWHFKIVMGETDVPKGEVYHCVEGGNGELGFYLVSDGGRCAYRLHFRRPCFIYYQAYPEMIKGSFLSDAILTMSSMNVIAGRIGRIKPPSKPLPPGRGPSKKNFKKNGGKREKKFTNKTMRLFLTLLKLSPKEKKKNLFSPFIWRRQSLTAGSVFRQ